VQHPRKHLHTSCHENLISHLDYPCIVHVIYLGILQKGCWEGTVCRTCSAQYYRQKYFSTVCTVRVVCTCNNGLNNATHFFKKKKLVIPILLSHCINQATMSQVKPLLQIQSKLTWPILMIQITSLKFLLHTYSALPLNSTHFQFSFFSLSFQEVYLVF
jgi:hypothetical protein